jgi:hypothetical protein
MAGPSLPVKLHQVVKASERTLPEKPMKTHKSPDKISNLTQITNYNGGIPHNNHMN